MPAAAPSLPSHAAETLAALGLRIRAARKAEGLAAASVAEAAGMSRVTLTRIERGEPSVTIGAYVGVIAALGLELRVAGPDAFDNAAIGSEATARVTGDARATGDAPARATGAADRIRIADYPQLAAVSWHVPGLTELTVQEARGIYERHWRHVDTASIGPSEAALLARLGLPVTG